MKKQVSCRGLLRTFGNAVLSDNAVLVQAMGLCPILAAGYDLKNGVALSVCTAVVLLPANLLLAWLGKYMAQWLRPAAYAVLTTALLLLTALVLRQQVSADIYAALYLFLPLMAVNALFTVRAVGKQAARVHPLVSLAESLGTAVGFAMVLCFACALREAAIDGTVWDIPLGFAVRFPEAKHPFIGYVMLGFMAAALQWLHRLWHRLAARKGEKA